MKIIYEPAGKAKEYCKLAVNLYRGCNHGCIYCYAPAACRVTANMFSLPSPRTNIIEKLRDDVKKNPGHGQHVLLSFTSDAYNKADKEMQLTRYAIAILKEAGYKIVVLTKAGIAATRDFDLLDKGDHVGATLTFAVDKDSLEWESGAALPAERMRMLRTAKENGISTWASLEPVIDPEQTKTLIRQTHSYVDMYKVGVLNYHPQRHTVDWGKFAAEVVALLQELGCKYYLKEDLKKHLA